MGRRIEIVLWTLIAASILLALAAHGTRVGSAAVICAWVLVGLWVISLLITFAAYRTTPGPSRHDAPELIGRLRAARGGGPLLAEADLAALRQLAASSVLDDAEQQEILDAVASRTGHTRDADLTLAMDLLLSSSKTLESLLAAFPGLTADEASRVAAAIARDAGLIARSTPRLLADPALLGSFAHALADAFSSDRTLIPSRAPDLARALAGALAHDLVRRSLLESRMS